MRPAAVFCERCDQALCDADVNHAWTGAGFEDQCLHCGTLVEPLSSLEHGEIEPGVRAYLQRLPAILRYPFKPAVALTLLGLAVANWVLDFAGIFGAVLALGIEYSLYFMMITRTAHGDEHLEPPDFSDFVDDILRPIGWMFVVHLPLITAVVWFLASAEEHGFFGAVAPAELESSRILSATGPAVLAIAGIALLPLLTAIAALGRSTLSILNPHLWWQALDIMRGTYAVGAVLYYLTYLFEVTLFATVLATLGELLDVPVIGSLTVGFLALLPMALRARIIGAMCRPFLNDF